MSPVIDLPGGGVAFVCTRGQRKPKACAFCGRPGSLLCDGKLERVRYPRKDGRRTCDKPMCRGCAEKRGPDIDFCPPCAKATPHQLNLNVTPTKERP